MGDVLELGMCFIIEFMVNVGKCYLKVLLD